MRSFFLKIRYSTAIILVMVAIVLLVVALLTIIYGHYEVRERTKEDVARESMALITALNMALDEASEAINTAKNSIGKPCSEAKYDLNKLEASATWVKSVTITHNKQLVCSSFFDEKSASDADMSHYIAKDLKLSYTKYLNPPRVVLTYNYHDGDWNIFANMNAKHIFREVPLSELSEKIYVVVGDNWLNSTEQIFFNKKKIDSPDWMIFQSSKYPFSVAADYGTIEKAGSLLWISAAVILTLLIIGLLITFYIVFTAPYRDLKRGLLNKEFIPYYQLITSTENDYWHGAEVLIRWQHPKKGLLLPHSFIELAESTDIIIEITRALMNQVAEDLKPYMYSLPKSFYLSFNIDSRHLKSGCLLDDCKEFLSKFPDNKIHLALELSERQLIDKKDLVELLKQIHDIGVTVAVDDFGTGYSNLGYLQMYDIDHLKIDRMFVSKISHMDNDPQLIDAIINLAKTMNMSVVAEGVENQDQLSYLKNLGVEYIQGFLFSKPLPINDTINKLFKLS